MEELKNFRQFLKDKLREKGLNIQKLSELVGISQKHLSLLLEDGNEKLPSLPYVRGYIKDIADVLEIDPEEFWQMYKKEYDLKSSGEKDTLPLNRFASKPINKKIVFGIVVGIALLAYVVPTLADFLGKPSIEIISPQADKIKSENQIFYLKGKVKDPSDKVLINENEVMVSSDGNFEKEVYLENGQNNFQFKVKRLLGKEIIVSRSVIYEQPYLPINLEKASSTDDELEKDVDSSGPKNDM